MTDIVPNEPSQGNADHEVSSDDLVMAPPSGLSPSQREAYSKTYPPVAHDEPTEKPFRFPIRSLLLLTLAIAIGLSGRTWVSAKIFAGILLVVANIVAFGVEIHRVDEPVVRSFVLWICVASAVALTVALFS